VDLNFKPSVPVFDANVALGRRHDRAVKVDSVEGTLEVMDQSGVDRALVYAPHAATYDSRDGNGLILETIQGEPRLVPQFVCNASFDDLDSTAAQIREQGVGSVRMLPRLHNYPFRDWVVGPWLDWLASERIPLWLPVDHEVRNRPAELDPRDIHDTVEAHTDLTVVLSEVRYADFSWAMPLLKSLPNVYIEISRFVITGGIESLMESIGEERILFGSRFPDSAMAAQLYSLHHSELNKETLEAICSGNLDRLLGKGARC
jgi:predicted TIM-barrel fold metal-dependent hydrolase